MAYKTTLLWEETVYPISFVTYVQCAAFHKYVRIYSSIYCINNRLAFFSFFLQKKNNYVSVQSGMLLAPIRSPHQDMYLTNQFAAVGYVSRTDQIVALGYVSRTNRIAAFGYLTPITAFGYCFLANDIIDEGAVHKE